MTDDRPFARFNKQTTYLVQPQDSPFNLNHGIIRCSRPFEGRTDDRGGGLLAGEEGGKVATSMRGEERVGTVGDGRKREACARGGSEDDMSMRQQANSGGGVSVSLCACAKGRSSI